MAERRRETDAPEMPVTPGMPATAPAQAPDAEESTYTRDDLMAGASGFGVQQETIAGAWHVAGFAPDQLVTRPQMAAAIEAFNTREVGPS